MARFKRFQERAPRVGEIARVKFPKKIADVLQVGDLVGIIYVAKGDRKTYIHKFKRRPLLYVSADGDQIYVLKGAYRLTDRGFVG